MRRLPRLGLLTRFSVLSLMCVVALGAALAIRLRDDADASGLAAGRRSAELLVGTTYAGLLRPADLHGELAPARRKLLDAATARAKRAGGLVRIKVWTPSGRIAYSDDGRIIGRAFPVEDNIRGALAGRERADISRLTDAEQLSERSFGRLVEVYVPLRLDGQSQPVGAFETYLPYGPIAAASDRQVTNTYLLLGAGLVLLWLALFRIIATASRRLRVHARESEYQARHDSLTGLANRRLLRERLVALFGARRAVALLLVDLDGFKEVNDTLGHAAGDELLAELGQRLARDHAAAHLVARLGGDEFAVVVDDADDAELLEFVDRIWETIGEPFLIAGVQLRVTASVGIARDAGQGEPGLLLQQADVAMYRAKRRHVRGEVYTPEADPHSPERLALMAELSNALDDDELIVHYQPTFSLESGEIVGAEALVRWQHPQRGLLLPAEFVPAAEQAGMSGKLTRRVLQHAIADAANWHARGLVLGIAVNISAHDLLDDHLAGDIERLLQTHAVPASALVLELTETAIVSDLARGSRMVQALAARGITIALDDFGTGYSSLAHLQQLPVRALKIDRSFVGRMLDDSSAALIVRATVDLGRALGLRIVAEGIEDKATLDALRQLHCHEAQGYYLARPQPVEALIALIAAQARRAA